MKILLVQPPVRDFYFTPLRGQSLGLAYVTASLKESGYEAEILDSLTNEKRSISVPQDLSYMMKYYNFKDRSPIKLYTGFYHFGMSYKDILTKIMASHADIFGVSSMFTPYYREALMIAALIKEWDSKKVVIFGGAHTTICPEQVLENPHVDYAVLGEGERRLPALLDLIGSGRLDKICEIDGVGYKENDIIKINPVRSHIPNPDELPIPEQKQTTRKIGSKRMAMILTSRGCPHKCAYCSHHVMGAYRKRSPESVINEIRHNNEKHSITAFDFEDDNFTFDLDRAKRIMNLIIETYGQGGLDLMAMNGISFAALDKELITLMKKAGFKTLNLSYVSIDDSMKYMLKRPKPLMEFEDVVDFATGLGLEIIAYCILGIPGQTIEEMCGTMIYLAGKRVLIGPSVYYPSPETPIFEQCRESGVLPQYQSQWRSSAFPVETKEFNRLDLVTLFRLARLINYIKSEIRSGKIPSGISLKNILETGQEKNTDMNEPDSACSLVKKIEQSSSFFFLEKDRQGIPEWKKADTSLRVLDYFFSKPDETVFY